MADEEGLLAAGGDLSVEALLTAYSMGIFPWYNQGSPILWWSPDPRMVLFPGELKVSGSLKQQIRSGKFTLRIDFSFDQVITQCACMPRNGQQGTWITDEMQKAYIDLHTAGYAHSFEVFTDGRLVGGLYGVSLGRAFFGESMFHKHRDASKVALYSLVQWCLRNDFSFIDAQVPTLHLQSMGAKEIPRNQFLNLLNDALAHPTIRGRWQ